MKLPKEKFEAAASDAKRRLENPLTKAQKAEKAAAKAERLRKIKRTANINSERLRAMAERRIAAEVEGLMAEERKKERHPLQMRACKGNQLVVRCIDLSLNPKYGG